MRSRPGLFRLSFALPAGWLLSYNGPQPLAHGCFCEVARYLVSIQGPSREAVFDDAATVFRALMGITGEPLSIAGTLETPHGRDTWSIILNADVAFSPTSLDPHFPRAATG
jgi:hypothetical protein